MKGLTRALAVALAVASLAALPAHAAGPRAAPLKPGPDERDDRGGWPALAVAAAITVVVAGGAVALSRRRDRTPKDTR